MEALNYADELQTWMDNRKDEDEAILLQAQRCARWARDLAARAEAIETR